MLTTCSTSLFGLIVPFLHIFFHPFFLAVQDEFRTPEKITFSTFQKPRKRLSLQLTTKAVVLLHISNKRPVVESPALQRPNTTFASFFPRGRSSFADYLPQEKIGMGTHTSGQGKLHQSASRPKLSRISSCFAPTPR